MPKDQVQIPIDSQDQVRILDIEEKSRDLWRQSSWNNQPEVRYYDWFTELERGLVYPWLRRSSTNGQ